MAPTTEDRTWSLANEVSTATAARTSFSTPVTAKRTRDTMRSVRGATVSQAIPRRVLPNHDMLSTEVTENGTGGWHITYEIDDARITRLDSREITMPDDGPAPDASPGVKRSLRNIYTYGGHPAKRNLTRSPPGRRSVSAATSICFAS